MNKEILIGIYKITSPSDKIYIGQAIDIYERWNDYKYLDCKGQRYIYNSLKKYGIDSHKFEILCSLEKKELTKSEIINELNILETFYINKFNSFIDDNPEFGMNLTRGGGSKEASNETRLKQSKSKMGVNNPFYGKTHTDECKKAQSERQNGRKMNPESVKKGAEKRTGLKRNDEFKNKIRLIKTGVKLSPETIDKMSKSRKGIIFSEETKLKISLSHIGKKKNPESVKKSADSKRGKKQSEETKLKKSIAFKGDRNPMYGKTGINSPNFGRKLSLETLNKISGENHWTKQKKISSETRKKQSIAKLGIKQNPESIKKRIEAVKLTWEKKRISVLNDVK